MTPEEHARDFAQHCGWALVEPGMRRVHEDDLTKAFLAYRQELIGDLTPDLANILGKPNFWCGPIAHAFVAAGRAKIATKAEAEQAFVIHWLLGHYLKHGSEWATHANAELNEIVTQAKAKAPSSAA